MLISLNKNKWLLNWIYEEYSKEMNNIFFNDKFELPRPNQVRSKIAQLLESKGYTVKITSKFDIIISMKDKEYAFLKLKYE